MESKFPPVHRPPAKSRPVQMKAQAVAPRMSRSQTVQTKRANGVVQMTPCNIHRVENCQLCGGLLGLLSGTVPGAQSITRNIFSFLSAQDLERVSVLSGASHDFASMELERRHRLELMRQSGRQNFGLGVFSGVYEIGLNRNWADLHITGALGHSIDNSDLVKILKWLYIKMRAWHQQCGVAGTLEWHPTGAVVTKQVVELLACTLGGKFKLAKAFFLQTKRKFTEDKGKRNKLAALIEGDILPEFFAFLDCLRGVQGIQLVGVFIQQPSSYGLLSPHNKMLAKEQNMLEDSPQGTERFLHFIQTYPQQNVPSLKVIIHYKFIPQLIEAILSHKK